MIGPNKILTVSYGTFSCTLEGFDDSFDTMKAIAEYFRGLAAEDRYFGAEPPQPDTDMLARIAEAQMAGRIEAVHSDQGVTLRPAAAPAIPPAQAAETPAPDAPVQPVPPSPEPAAAPLDNDSIAAKLQRIRAVVDHRETEDDIIASFAGQTQGDAPETAPADVTDTAQEIPSEPIAEAATVETPPAEGADPQDTDIIVPAEDVAPIEESAETDITSVPEDTAPVDDAAPIEDAERMETTASDMGDHGALELVSVDAIPAEPDAAASIDEIAETDIAPQDAEPADAPEPEDMAEEEDEVSIDAITAALAAAQVDAPVDDTAADAIAPEAAQPDETTRALVADLMGADTAEDDAPEAEAVEIAPPHTEADREDAIEDAPAEQVSETPAEPASEPEISEPEAEILTEDAPEEASAPESADTEEVTPRVRARIIRMRRRQATAEAAEATQAEGGPAQTDNHPNVGLVDLDGFDEFEDSADGPIESIFEDNADVPETATVEVAEDAAPITPRRPRKSAPPAQRADTDVSRLMDQTDTALDAPDANARRDALAHLKAAVAATEAARRLGEQAPDPAAAAEGFRDDLRQAIGDTSRPAKPEFLAPLKLVASQRIDTPPPAAKEPEPTPAPEPEEPATYTELMIKFSEFCKEVGAGDEFEILEAAAVFLHDQVGRTAMSRRELLSMLRDHEPEVFDRDEGIKAFSALLDEGRLERVAQRRVSITDKTRYREQRQSA